MFKKISILAAVSAIVLFSASVVFAATPLSGYAWSSTIGWLSFNSFDGATVQLATTSGSTIGTLSGYAWSPNIGWVQFGGLNGEQVNNTTVATDATVDTSSGAVSGWARAIAGVGRSDGWDGWIELADSGANAKHPTGDTSGTGGVTFLPSTNKFTGYAWGSDVVGWLSFSNTDSNGSTTAVTVGSSTAPTCNMCDPSCASYNPSDPSCTSVPVVSCLSPGSETVNSGNSFSISWSNTVSSTGGANGSYTYLWSDDGINFSQSTSFPGISNGGNNPYPYSIFVEIRR